MNRPRTAVGGVLVLLLGALLPVLATVSPAHAAEEGAPSATCSATQATAVIESGTVALGGTLVLRGAGWCHPDGDGSTVGVKIDAGSVSRTDTSVHSNTTIWALVQAEDDGTFTARIQVPDGTTATSTPALSTGPHTLQLLTGSLRPGDEKRTLQSTSFDVVADTPIPSPTPLPTPTPSCSSTARPTASIESRSVPLGGTLVLSGTGWCHPEGGGSRIGVKIDEGAVSRTDTSVHTNKTIWALVQAEDDGTFTARIQMPDGTTATSTPALSTGPHTLRLLTGSLRPNDSVRTMESTTFDIVAKSPASPACSSNAPPTAVIGSRTVPLGGTLVLRGTGWCHPEGGGSRIGLKIDDGAVSRTDTSVHTNKTIWALVQAEDDGTFTARVQLPDGTTTTSTPALATGAHTLRLLTGSLRPNDAVRTLESAAFTVGGYRPNGIPDPVSFGSDLSPATRHGVKATLVRRQLQVSIPGADEGDWVFLSVYGPDGSPRYPWGERWFQVGARGLVKVALGAGAPSGLSSIVVQSGALADNGALVGWDDLRLPDTAVPGSTGAAAVNAVGGISSNVSSSPSTTALDATANVPAAIVPAGLTVPAAPVAAYSALQAATRLPATLKGTVLTMRLPSGTPGPVYLRVLDESRVFPGGWAEPDRRGRVRVDLDELGEGPFRVIAQSAAGALLGWSQANLPTELLQEGEAPGAGAAGTPRTRPVAASSGLGFAATDAWLLAAGALLLGGTGLILRLRRPTEATA